MTPASLNPALIDAPSAMRTAAAAPSMRDSFAARLLVRGLLSMAACAERVGRGVVDAQPLRDQLRLVLVGTFYHENWLRAHLAPLLRCPSVESINVVGEGPEVSHERVRYHHLPSAPGISRVSRRWRTLRRVVRAVKPDVIIGYHIMPNALLALAAARLSGARAIYQMTGGPVQLSGGGWQSENPLLSRMGRPSAALERQMFALARRFDAIVVRGETAARFVTDRALNAICAAIPGAVDVLPAATPVVRAEFDLICVGRLVDVKRVDRALEIIAALQQIRRTVRAAIVGDGPLMEALRQRARVLGLIDAVAFLGRREDVAELLTRSRAFLLTSSNEGLSIAALEAMASGLPLISPCVGDMGVVLEDRMTGLTIDADEPDAAAKKIDALLHDEAGRSAMGTAARERVRRVCGTEHVASLWASLFEQLRNRARNGGRR